MPGHTPEETDRLLEEAVTAGDVDAAVRCFEEHAVFVAAETGDVIRGREAIRQLVQEFLAMRPTLRGRRKRVVSAGDLALVISEWTLEGTGPDGEAFRQNGVATDVMRRQADGTWLYVIDNPAGVEIAGGGSPPDRD